MVSANCSRMKIAKATYHVRRSDVSAYVTLVKISVVLIACSNKLGAVLKSISIRVQWDVATRSIKQPCRNWLSHSGTARAGYLSMITVSVKLKRGLSQVTN